MLQERGPLCHKWIEIVMVILAMTQSEFSEECNDIRQRCSLLLTR